MEGSCAHYRQRSVFQELAPGWMSPFCKNEIIGRPPVVFNNPTMNRTEPPAMTIEVLTTSYPSHEHDWSGVFIAKLLQAVTRRGHHVKVIAPSDGEFHGKRRLHGIETLRFPYFIPRALHRLTRGGGGIPENLRESNLAKVQLLPMMVMFFICSLWNSRRADLIYANWLGAGIVGAAVSMLTGKPLVISFRGDDGYLARDRLLWRLLTKWVSKRAAAIAPVSSELLEIIRTLGVPEEKLYLPRFGVDAEMFVPAEQPVRNSDPVRVIYAGALIPKKGIQTLFQALNHESLRDVCLVLVGDGYYADELRSLCESAGLSQRTHWTGSLSPPAVAEEMRRSDILCLPSFTEGSPNVIKEAMACGLPVVASRVGGVPDLVREGETGLLFEAGDANQLRTCLVKLVADGHLRRKMGAAAREHILVSGMTWDDTAKDFEEIFLRVL